MRYENWDVLLFPSGTKTPIQEFNTRFHVVQRSHDKLTSQSQDIYEKSDTKEVGWDDPVPTLTCFIPSLQAGKPFHISIHSWDKPKPSQLLINSKESNELVLYEAKIYMDGIVVAQCTFNAETSWPVIVDSMELYPTDQNSNDLRFPPFHASVLSQSYWNAGDNFGRIKVVISEGVLRNGVLPTSRMYSFDRLWDIIWFSFQHAPQDILDQAGIAWPNRKAFQNVVPRAESGSNKDTHAHSPYTVERITCVTPAIAKDKVCSSKADTHSSTGSCNKPGVALHRSIEDPFTEPDKTFSSKLRRQPDSDTTMADVNSCSEMSGVAMHITDFQKQMSQAAVNEIVDALSPSMKMELFHALSPESQMVEQEVLHHLRATGSRTPIKVGKFALESIPQRDVSTSSATTDSSTSGPSSVLSSEVHSDATHVWGKEDSFSLTRAVRSETSQSGSMSSISTRKKSSSPVMTAFKRSYPTTAVTSRSISPTKPRTRNRSAEKKSVLNKVGLD